MAGCKGGGRSEGHMHTTVKPGEPASQPALPPLGPPCDFRPANRRAESFPLEDTDARRCLVRRQFGLTSTMEWEGTGDLLSITHGLFASYRPPEGLSGPSPASRRASAYNFPALSHAHPYALYDLEDSWKRKENRQLRNQTADAENPILPAACFC